MGIVIPARRIIRIVSLLYVPLHIAVSIILLHSGFSPDVLLGAFMTSNFILLIYPQGHESTGVSLSFTAILVLSVISVLLFSDGFPPALPAGLVFSAYSAVRAKGRVADMRRLFRNDAPWLCMEECHRSVCAAVVLSLGAWSCASGSWPVSAVAVSVFLIQYVCACSGHLVILGPEKEDMLRNLIKGDLRSLAAASCDDDARMSTLYARVVSYMQEKKPYLQEDFSLAEFSRLLFTNKTYLSRVINYYSGRNFKQFVNYYRVMYSVELIKKDPRLTVMELASMSGFHSVVTYNVAFRLNMNDTPGSYSRCLPRE